MRYVLTISIILGLSAISSVQADEVGSGYTCPACMTGDSTTTTEPVDSAETEDRGVGDGTGGGGGGGWWAEILDLIITTEE